MELLLLIIIICIVYIANKNNQKQPNFQISKPKLNERRLDISDITLSDEQKKILEILENTSDNVFITGKAGTGKSVLLQYFKKNSSKKLVVCAPTGIAAINVGGQTIHSLFKIPPSFIKKDSLKLDYKTINLLRNIDTVVIDEISMVRADLMDAIDFCLRQARNSDKTFGGVQIVMFGDLYQLPPVVSDPELHKYFADNHSGFYFFNADAWKNTELKIFELNHIFRQKDEDFKEVLNSIRIGNVEETVLLKINQRSGVEIPENNVVTLATTNKIVNEINSQKLERLPGEVKEYKATITGYLEETTFPTEEFLKLKVGAQVMFLKNDKDKRWVNGTIGSVYSLSDKEIIVNVDGIKHSVPQETWSKIRYYYNQVNKSVEEEIVSSFTQFPLRLAWAITIHKSQGKTYGSVIIGMGDGAFAHGQTYVALSRCKSFEGLYLKKRIRREDIMVDNSVVSFMSNAKIINSKNISQEINKNNNL